MNFQYYLGLMLVLTQVAACGPMSSGTVQDLNVRDWIGHSSSHLVQSWGKPDHEYPTADGGRAFGYMFSNPAMMEPDYSTGPAYFGPVYYRSVTGPTSSNAFQATNCMINFTVDRNGIVDDATITGTKCRIGPHGRMHPPNSKT